MEFLIGSPFTTPVGQRIERATSSSLQTEDWALNMEICDLINETGEGPKDAVKAIKKRIMGNKNFREVMLALTVLEACVKNCGQRFHVLVSTREFVEGVLVRTILPKNNPPLVLHDRVLSIIQAWADAFRSSPALTGVVSVYEDLRRKGLEFPMVELEGYSPLHTPDRSVPERGSMTVCAAPLSSAPPSPPAATPARSEQHASIPPCQVKKLKEDLVVVRGNLTLMSDMMSQLEPVSANHTDRELLQQLYGVVKDVQDRVVDLVPRLSEEALIEELLAANDHINTTFIRYHRFERQMSNCQNTKQQSHTYVNLMDLNPAAKPHNQSQSAAKPDDQSEFAAAPAQRHLSQSTVDSMSSQMTRLTTEAGGFEPSTHHQQSERRAGAAEGRTVAQSSSLLSAGADDPDPTPLGSSPQFDRMVEKGMMPVSQTTVMDDIERWLDEDVDADEEELTDSEGVTSEEFDRFLAERARAAERLPSLTASSNTSQSQP